MRLKLEGSPSLDESMRRLDSAIKYFVYAIIGFMMAAGAFVIVAVTHAH